MQFEPDLSKTMSYTLVGNRLEAVSEFIASRLIPLSFMKGRYCEMSSLTYSEGK